MITVEQLDDVQLLHRDRGMHFNVQPRYTAGSPGVVDQDEALRVARSEVRLYNEALAGVYGDEDLVRASVVGLDGISILRVEMSSNWRIYDLITASVWEEPFVT